MRPQGRLGSFRETGCLRVFLQEVFGQRDNIGYALPQGWYVHEVLLEVAARSSAVIPECFPARDATAGPPWQLLRNWLPASVFAGSIRPEGQYRLRAPAGVVRARSIA